MDGITNGNGGRVTRTWNKSTDTCKRGISSSLLFLHKQIACFIFKCMFLIRSNVTPSSFPGPSRTSPSCMSCLFYDSHYSIVTLSCDMFIPFFPSKIDPVTYTFDSAQFPYILISYMLVFCLLSLTFSTL